LSKQQQVSEIMRQMLTQAQTAGQYFTNDQIKEMTRKVSAEVDLVHQQTQNQRYGSSHIILAGQIGRLITISTTPVIAGDSFEMDAVGALRLSPLRRGLAIDSTVDIFTFY